MRGAFTGVLLISALDIVQGGASLGSFVAVQTYILNLFAPLLWLGRWGVGGKVVSMGAATLALVFLSLPFLLACIL